MLAAYKAAAMDLRRYSVPQDAQLTVQGGIAMQVSGGFMIDGQLILNGMLKEEDND